MKEQLFAYLDTRSQEMNEMADAIFTHPETAHNEYFASSLLCDFLTKEGFQVERGLGRQETAFRAEQMLGNGNGPSIGLLCEYDALEGLGHACGHHMQGPGICGTAVALKKILDNKCNGKIIVYGTPAEESGGGKIILLEDGYLKDIDVALMLHGSPTTCVDVKSMAAASMTVTFHGKSAHAALKPEAGRSAFDALLLSFNGLEFLREHVREDSRIHYTMQELPGPANIVPAKAVGAFSVRSYNSVYLHDELLPRFCDVMRGAAIMTGTSYEIKTERILEGKVPAYSLNEIVMENARLVGAPRIRAPREKTGSSDFGNVMYEVPGCCIRIAFVPEGTSSHSQMFLDMGLTEEAHQAILYAAKILAGTAWDLLSDNEHMETVKNEFRENKARLKNM